MEQNNQVEQEKREARRKRRVRNQILAYLTVILLIIAVAAGVVYGVQYLQKTGRLPEQDQANQQEQQEQMPDTEEALPEPSEESVPEETLPPEPTPQEKLDEIINARIEVMPIEDKVAGLFIVTPESITGVNTAVKAGNGTKDALTKYPVGGIVYSKKNIQNASQFKEMIDNTKLYTAYPMFVAIADEGGKYSPLGQAGLVEKTSIAEAVAVGGAPDAAYETGGVIGAYLYDYGFNLDFAPVADINVVQKSVIGDRSYGSETDLVSSFVSSMTRGIDEQGVNTCLKYFPGMGSTTQDTNKGLASTDRSAEDFRANEFVVFQAGIEAGADMIMVSHMAAPSLSGDNTPCSLSSAVVTDILRNEMKFNGVIITDAMNAAAISEYYGADEAAILALRAGCDMILMPENFEKAYNGVLEAVQRGEISEERINDALRRIYRVKDADKLEE